MKGLDFWRPKEGEKCEITILPGSLLEHVDHGTARKCVGCGYCCITATCTLGLYLHGYEDKRCPELFWDGEKYRCRIAAKNPVAADHLYVGMGCCSPLNSWRKDVKRRDENGTSEDHSS